MQRRPPVKQVDFGGIYTAGDILKRPATSSVVCKDFRVMPGNYLRLRGGRSLWVDAGTGNWTTLHEFRKGEFGGGIYHLAEQGGAWKQLDLVNKTLTPIETIDGTHPPEDGGVISNVRGKVFWTNGYGTRVGGISQPALSSWDGSRLRYVGLDPFVSGSTPTAAFSPNPSGETVIRYSRTFYVGLYNSATGHFSNGIEVGTITNPDPETDYIGDLSITGLTGISRSSHDAAELAEVYYCVYATLDGGAVPYLVMVDSGLTPLTTQSASISIDLDDNAVFGATNPVDTTKEMPLENFPPRAMNLGDYANGRFYYAPRATTSPGSEVNFSYKVEARDETTVGWSAASDDVNDRDFLGNPEESFPLSNKKSTPNGEAPKLIRGAGGNFGHVIVCTQSGTYLLEETLPGVHAWRTVSNTEGILDKDTFVRTPYGDIWMTQKKELVLLRPGDDTLIFISKPYNSILNFSGISASADYLYDPENYIDRYQVWIGSGESVIHDFTLEPYPGAVIPGQAYTTSNQSVGVAKTMDDQWGARYHLMSIGSKLYVQEKHPVSKTIPTRDEGASGVYSEINGEYVGQWLDFGDGDVRKEFRAAYLLGDGNYSTALSDRPIKVTWYGDLTSAPANLLEFTKDGQSTANFTFRAGVPDGHRFWYKFKLTLNGHGTEGSYHTWFDDGELAPSFYGAIHRFLLQISGESQNRA